MCILRFSLAALFALLITPADAVDESKWQLTWQDEFNGETLDSSKWSRCKRAKSDWNNTMSDDPNLVQLENGILRLRGVQNPDTDSDPSPFLTAGVHSKGKFSFCYGKIQVKARFKSAQGAWPAIWMLGESGGWPNNGEIDLMEHLNFDRKAYQTLHSYYTLKVDKTNTPRKGVNGPINRDGWNTYGCEWDEDSVVFTINGKATHTYPRVPEKGPEQWPFKHPFYLLLTMQIGGGWVNGPGPSKPEHYPAHLEIDWVRVYKPAGDK